MAKVQISIDDKLLGRVDRFAEEMSTSRSGAIAFGMTNYLNQQEVVFYVRDAVKALRKIADTNEIDEESKKQLADLENAMKYFVGK